MISGFVLTIKFIISTHFCSLLLSNELSFSSLYAASKFIKSTPTNKFIMKNDPTSKNRIKKYAVIGELLYFGPSPSLVASIA
jgi:hypothetical protein